MEVELCALVTAVPGDEVGQTAEAMINIANSVRAKVLCYFNGTLLVAEPGMSRKHVLERYR